MRYQFAFPPAGKIFSTFLYLTFHSSKHNIWWIEALSLIKYILSIFSLWLVLFVYPQFYEEISANTHIYEVIIQCPYKEVLLLYLSHLGLSTIHIQYIVCVWCMIEAKISWPQISSSLPFFHFICVNIYLFQWNLLTRWSNTVSAQS